MLGRPILVIDDNPLNMKLVRLLLADEGFEVHGAGSATEALALLERISPPLILMDIQLPGMDGLELTQLLRTQARLDSVWIVALTAYAMPADEEKARKAGCDGYITKPIDTTALPDVLRGYLATPRRHPV